MEKFGKYIWAISDLTKIIGDSFTTYTNDAKSVHWHSKKTNYFFTLLINKKGELVAWIADSNHPKIYAITGYCTYHNIRICNDWIKEESE